MFQAQLDTPNLRMRSTEHAAHGPRRILEHLRALLEIVECGTGVLVERLSIKPPHPERGLIVTTENALRRRSRFA